MATKEHSFQSLVQLATNDQMRNWHLFSTQPICRKFWEMATYPGAYIGVWGFIFEIFLENDKGTEYALSKQDV